MEISTITTSSLSSSSPPLSCSSTPVSFFNNNHLEFNHLKPSIPALNSWRNQTKRTHLHIKAIKSSFQNLTLSSNWEISGATSASWLPKFEELDTTNMLLRQRIIFLGSEIDDMTADFMISQLLLLDAEDSKKDIKLLINSSGGSVTAGMGIYDAMKQCKADVSTICMGLAASMALLLLASGTKGKRYCMPNSKVMIREPYGAAGGSVTDVMIRTREMSYHEVKRNKIFSRITGKPEQQIELDTKRDVYMNPWEAKEYGLVDDVIDDGKPGLIAPIGGPAPPPDFEVGFLWKFGDDLKVDMKDLPSERKLLQKRLNGGQGSDEEKGTSIEKDVSTPA